MVNEQATGSGDVTVKQWLINAYKAKKLSRNDARYHIAQALAGDLTVLNIGMAKLSSYIHGLMNDRIFLIGADSSVGKTTLTDWMLISAILDALKHGIPIKVKYYSWEISRAMKEAKWLSMFIFLIYKKRLASDYLLGRMKGYEPSENELRMVMQAYKEIQKVMACIDFVEADYTPSEIDDQVIALAEEKGKIRRSSTGKDGKIIGYEKYDPKSVEFVVIDHVALAGTEFGEKTKETIDSNSQNAVKHRNLFGISTIFIQQFSTDLQSIHRNKGRGANSLIPQRVDFGDSKYTFRDADVVLGLLRPADFDVVDYFDYDISELGRFFVANHVMKNRYGDAGVMLPQFMDYIPGIPMDLPADPTAMFDMEQFLDLKRKIETCKEQYCRKIA